MDVLAAEYGVRAGLKWPNDVLVEGRKLAGFLCEVEPGTAGDGRVAIALGLGVNLSVARFPEGIDAVSLHTLLAAPPSADELLEAWGSALGPRVAMLKQGGIGMLLADWRRVAVGLGGPVTVHTHSGVIEGVALDVAEDGALLVEASGHTHRFLAADVHLGGRRRRWADRCPERSGC